MSYIVPIVFVYPFSVEHQLVQVVYVLFDYIGDVLKLGQFVAVVLNEHALGTDYRVTNFAEILYFFFWMLRTKYFSTCLWISKTGGSIIEFFFYVVGFFRFVVVYSVMGLIKFSLEVSTVFLAKFSLFKDVHEFLIEKERVIVVYVLDSTTLGTLGIFKGFNTLEAEGMTTFGKDFRLFVEFIELFLTVVTF